MKKAEIITKENFDSLVLESDKPVMIDFWHTLCPPCKRILPIIDELAEDFDGETLVGKINVEEEEELTRRFGIKGIPAICIFYKDEIVSKVIGPKPKHEYAKMLEDAIKMFTGN